MTAAASFLMGALGAAAGVVVFRVIKAIAARRLEQILDPNSPLEGPTIQVESPGEPPGTRYPVGLR